MADEAPVYKLELELDPTKLTQERIKQIGDSIVAQLAQAAAGARGGADHQRSHHDKGHIKW